MLEFNQNGAAAQMSCQAMGTPWSPMGVGTRWADMPQALRTDGEGGIAWGDAEACQAKQGRPNPGKPAGCTSLYRCPRGLPHVGFSSAHCGQLHAVVHGFLKIIC